MNKKITILLASIFLIISGCVTPQSRLKQSTPVEPVEIIKTLIEIGPVVAEYSFPGSSTDQIGTLEKYLASKLSSSPYYEVALTGQERVVTGSLGKVESRYVLTLNMINYNTTALESSVSVDFLSMNEFDYAVDIAVLKLEGRDILTTEQMNFPDLAIKGFSPEELDIQTQLPDVTPEIGDESKRVDGMLREILSQGEYHLWNGDYTEAIAVFEGFQTRFDQGIVGALASEMGYLREYSETQENQAILLLDLQGYEGELEGINELAGQGSLEQAYASIRSLYDEVQLKRESNPVLYDKILNKLRNDQAILYSRILKIKLIEVEDQIEAGDYSAAYYGIRTLRMEMDLSGTDSTLPEIYANIRSSEIEIKRSCQQMEKARTEEFSYNLGYFGFNGDESALQTVFSEYRYFLSGSPYAFVSARGFNRQLQHYNELFNLRGVTPIPAPADLEASYYNYPQGRRFPAELTDGVEAVRFPAAELELKMIYRYGSAFIEYLKARGEDPVRLNSILDEELGSPRIIDEIRGISDNWDRLSNDSFEELIQENPSVTTNNRDLARLEELYRNFLVEEDIAEIDTPDLIETIIDFKGFPLYLVQEMVMKIEGHDAFYHYEYTTTLIYHGEDNFETHTLFTDTFPGFHQISLDMDNRPVVSYLHENKYKVIRVSSRCIEEFPPIERYSKRVLYEVDNHVSELFQLMHISYDNNNNPQLLSGGKKGLVSYTLNQGKWESEVLREGEIFFPMAEGRRQAPGNETLLLYFNETARDFRDTGTLLVVSKSGESWSLEDLPRFETLREDLYDGQRTKYYLSDDDAHSPDIMVLISGWDRVIWIDKEAGDWQAIQKDIPYSGGGRGERKMIDTDDGPLSIEMWSYGAGGYYGIFGLGSMAGDQWIVFKKFDTQSAFFDIADRSTILLPDGYGYLYLFDKRGFIIGRIAQIKD
ncbi:MAG: hypothetical protein JEY99_00010 [Spirochaetales bacterium]|nr:hypothetical protein [Spirochaetales bacterium]